MADAKEKVDPLAAQWIKTIAVYEREYKKWEGRTQKILNRYRDEQRQGKESNGSRFNILWSNVQTAIPAVFQLSIVAYEYFSSKSQNENIEKISPK